MSGDGALSWRPIEPGDARDWAELLAAIQAADHDWEYYTEEDLLEEFSDPYREFTRGSIACYDGRTMVGYGALIPRTAAEPVHDMRYEGGVHPAYRERGLGGQLLDWAETAAIPIHRERYPGRPLSLSGSCLSSNPGAKALFGGRGYQPVRWFHAMVRDLPAAPAASPGPEGVQIIRFTPERSEDARLVRNESFRDHWGSIDTPADDWAQFIGYRAFRPEFSFLAYAGTEPLGVIICHEYEGYAAATGVRDLYIALVGTRRAARQRGIASALMIRSLREAQAAGFTAASLAVDADSPTGALGLYQRTGFTVEHTSIRHTKSLLAAETADRQPPGPA